MSSTTRLSNETHDKYLSEISLSNYENYSTSKVQLMYELMSTIKDFKERNKMQVLMGMCQMMSSSFALFLSQFIVLLCLVIGLSNRMMIRALKNKKKDCGESKHSSFSMRVTLSDIIKQVTIEKKAEKKVV
jgi:hypothetical protein